jgi:hypothetical protein
MAIALGNGTYSNLNPNGTSQTLAHNSDSGTNRLLLVVIEMQNSVDVTGMTYNGVSMTEIRNENDTGISKRLSAYYLLSPATGTNDIVVSFSGSQFNNTAIFARTFTGASGIGNDGYNTTATSPHTQSLTISANSIIFATGMSVGAQSFGYDFDAVTATNVGNGFNINIIVEGAYSQTGLTAGSKDVVTKADSGTVSNYRVEIQESAATRRRVIIV